eukprot:PITA_17085
MALSKVDNLPALRSTQEADTKELKEKEEETMPDVEEPLDPIDPRPPEPSSSRKRPSWLKGTLDDAEGHTTPRGTFRESKKPNRLKKALYGLKQAPRAWYERIDSYLMKLGFTRSEADPNLYFKVIDDKPLIPVLYVDDLFLIGADPHVHECKRELASKFEMKDVGLMHYFLGLEVWQKLGEIFLSQGKYVVKILERFGMVDCKPVTTLMELDFKKLSGSAAGPVLRNTTEYRQRVRELMFLVNSRADICFAINTLSQHMVEPHHIHWIGAKNLLRYLRGTITYGLTYTAGNVRLLGYNANWAGNVVDRKSTSGFCFSLGFALISWMSKTQKSVALSTAEAEYIVASMASCEAIWL